MDGRIKGVVVKTEQGWFCLDPDEQFVSKSLLETGAYGQGEIEQARQFCDAGSRVLVVGAHIGTVAIPLARSCEELVAIEANPETYEFLKPLSAHFSTLTVPSTGQQAGKKEILGVLRRMFDNNQGDAGIIFQK